MYPFPNKTYSIIYADPPWKYNDRRNTHTRFRGGAMAHYDVMAPKDIMRLPVSKISKNNAVLLLWAVFPKLDIAMDVIKAWGFKYRTVAITWVKTNKKNDNPFFGVGYYFKSNAEVCLLATKGKTLKPISNRESSLVISPRQEHSKKPDIVRDKIVNLFGDLPRIELFARQKTDGWDVWGNEVSNETRA